MLVGLGIQKNYLKRSSKKIEIAQTNQPSIFFHRQFESRTCCGKHVAKDFLEQVVKLTRLLSFLKSWKHVLKNIFGGYRWIQYVRFVFPTPDFSQIQVQVIVIPFLDQWFGISEISLKCILLVRPKQRE
jgi:hypothetical protein